MDMRTDAEKLSTQVLNMASAILNDNNSLNEHSEQRDDNVETSSKKSDSGIYMESNGDNQSWPAQQMHNQYRDADSGHVEHGPTEYQDETASYMEDSASVLSNTTTISSLIDEGDEGKQVLNIETSNPSRLFWVPAEQHPEIAPAEFANWLQTHGVIRSKGQLRVRRKRSVLSISYLPGQGEDDNHSKDHPSFARRRSYDSSTQSSKSQPPVHTIPESPIVEETEEISPSNVTTNDILRRTVSLNVPSTIGKQSSAPSRTHIFDRHSTSRDESPVLVPRQEGSLLRRSARTRIKKTSLRDSQSEEPGRRASRRSQSAHIKPSDYPERFGVVPPGGVTLQDRAVSISELIDFGGADYEPAESQQGIITRVNDAENEVFSRIAAEESEQKKASDISSTNVIPSHLSVVPEATEAPAPEHVNIPTSPELKEDRVQFIIPNGPNVPPVNKQDSLPQKSKIELNKSHKPVANIVKPEKRSSWPFKFLSDDKAKKKLQQRTDDGLRRVDSVSSVSSSVSSASDVSQSSSNLVKSNMKEVKATDNVTSPGKKFGFSTLFQRTSSKSQKTSPNGSPPPAKKSAKSTEVTVVNDDYSRFPMHIERAVYRLSHYKLSNPRRPLHHQVLISNLMFWYLSIINGQNVRQHQSRNAATQNGSPTHSPQSFIVNSQENYQEEQEAAPSKMSKVGKFIIASKKRRQEIMVKKQMQQQQHHQPRWLPTISETISQSDDTTESKTKPGHIAFAPVPNSRHEGKDEEQSACKLPPTTSIQDTSNPQSQPTNKRRSGGDKYSPIPNDQYQPSVAHTASLVPTAALLNLKENDAHPLPPIPGPPLLTEMSSFDSFSDDILNSFGWEDHQSAEDDDVPLALYNIRH